jgi:hypothetical protein
MDVRAVCFASYGPAATCAHLRTHAHAHARALNSRPAISGSDQILRAASGPLAAARACTYAHARTHARADRRIGETSG